MTESNEDGEYEHDVDEWFPAEDYQQLAMQLLTVSPFTAVWTSNEIDSVDALLQSCWNIVGFRTDFDQVYNEKMLEIYQLDNQIEKLIILHNFSYYMGVHDRAANPAVNYVQQVINTTRSVLSNIQNDFQFNQIQNPEYFVIKLFVMTMNKSLVFDSQEGQALYDYEIPAEDQRFLLQILGYLAENSLPEQQLMATILKQNYNFSLTQELTQIAVLQTEPEILLCLVHFLVFHQQTAAIEQLLDSSLEPATYLCLKHLLASRDCGDLFSEEQKAIFSELNMAFQLENAFEWADSLQMLFTLKSMGIFKFCRREMFQSLLRQIPFCTELVPEILEEVSQLCTEILFD